MKLLIDIPESIYDTIQADEMISREQLAVLQMHILNGIPHETVTEFADRCRECGAKYGKLLKQEQSGDLISRDSVIEIIHRFFTEEVDKIPTKKTEDGEVYVIHKCQPLFEMNKAICKRIKALPSVSPTQNCVGNALDMRCGDAISRQAVLDVINLNWEYRRNCIRAIEKLPPVNPQPNTGHWEWVQYDENPKLGDWHCSECRCVVVECVYKNEKGGIPLYKYCPQCGRRMVEPQESEDNE